MSLWDPLASGPCPHHTRVQSVGVPRVWGFPNSDLHGHIASILLTDSSFQLRSVILLSFYFYFFERSHTVFHIDKRNLSYYQQHKGHKTYTSTNSIKLLFKCLLTLFFNDCHFNRDEVLIWISLLVPDVEHICWPLFVFLGEWFIPIFHTFLKFMRSFLCHGPMRVSYAFQTLASYQTHGLQTFSPVSMAHCFFHPLNSLYWLFFHAILVVCVCSPNPFLMSCLRKNHQGRCDSFLLCLLLRCAAWFLCQLGTNLHILEKRRWQLRSCLIRKSFGHVRGGAFLMSKGCERAQPTMGTAMPGQVVLGI